MENFTTYTETDPNNRFTVTATNIAVSGLGRSEDAFVYDDKGAAFFDGDLTHRLNVSIDNAAAPGINSVWTLANAVDDATSLPDYITVFFGFAGGNHLVLLRENDGGSLTDDVWTDAVQSTTYYLEIERDETAGDLICRIFSDASFSTLVITLTVSLSDNTVNWRYIYASLSFNDDAGGAFDGHVANLNLAPLAGDSSHMLLLF